MLRVLGDKLELREFAVFGALAFARNGRLPDDLEQRSIIVEMQRRRADEQLAELREDRIEPLHKVARMCARWAEDNAAYVADCEPDMGELINRNADNWRVLFAIAKMIGADWPERIRDSAAVLTPRESESIGPMLLADIKAIFADKNTGRLASAEICEALAAMEGRPWAEWRVKNASPKPISQNQLARLLKDFHVYPENIYTGGARRPKGYLLERFAEAFSRFLEPQGVNEPLNRYTADEMGTSDAFRTAQPEFGVADQKCKKPASNGRCSGLADQNGEDGSAQVNGESCPPVCEHCGSPDRPDEPVLLCGANGRQYLLHAHCQDEWLGDGLDIPVFLRRNQ